MPPARYGEVNSGFSLYFQMTILFVVCRAVVDSMAVFPFGRAAVIRLAVATVLPILPLILTVIPFDQLLDRLFRSLL